MVRLFQYLFKERRIYLCILYLLSQKMLAQIEIEEEPKRLYFNRTQRIHKFLEMRDMRDVFHKDKYLMGKNRITGNLSYNFGRVIVNDGHSFHDEYRSAIGLFTRIRFFEQFSMNTTFFKDFNPKAAAPWIADFNYTIGRYNWKPNKFNFGYENYMPNKYTDNWKEFSDKFLQGYYFVSYTNNLFKKVIDKIKLDSTTMLKFTYFVRYAPYYKDLNSDVHGGLLEGKPTVGAGFRYTIIWNMYVESAFYIYPVKDQKQPWDPDYSYGFGYFDWRSFRFSITYGNWSVNRFPWNETFYPHYGFLDGNFRFIFNYIW